MIDSMNWTFLAGFYAGGKSDEEVTVHRVADRGDSERRRSWIADMDFVRDRARPHLALCGVRSGECDQVYDRQVAAERQSRRSRYLRVAAVRAAARYRGAGRVMTDA